MQDIPYPEANPKASRKEAKIPPLDNPKVVAPKGPKIVATNSKAILEAMEEPILINLEEESPWPPSELHPKQDNSTSLSQCKK